MDTTRLTRLWTRIPRRALPSTPMKCPYSECVYNEDGICDEPRTNKGNSDAKCYRMSNRDLLRRLE